MLVLGRKDNESILIGDNIRVTIVGRSGGCIKIGVQAPSDVKIVREEICGAVEFSARPIEDRQAAGQPSAG